MLRFEHERKAAPPASALQSALDDERAAWSRERDQLRAEIEKLAEHARGNGKTGNGHHEAAAFLIACVLAGLAAALQLAGPRMRPATAVVLALAARFVAATGALALALL